jgi:acrylyl-CoA reductase (NADPH)
MTDSFRCFLVRKVADRVEAGVEQRPLRELPAGDVLIRVAFSSLNYKDAMAATGHPGIVKSFPHVPGIDAAGTVAESDSPRFKPGDEVFSTGHGLGAEHWGGWAEYIRVPADWVLPRPAGLSLAEAMTLGTAGFTAAQGVVALRENGITPEKGEVVVTGATGGVGTIAIMLLAKLGYRVVAITGKQQQHERLKQLGAARIVGREELTDESTRPLLSAKYAGGIDTVGGIMLATLIRSLQHRGCVANCGLVGGADLPLTVYPFILRGVRLSGIDSAWCPEDQRAEIWKHLSGDWKPEGLESLASFCGLDDVEAEVQRILEGGASGRVVVRL